MAAMVDDLFQLSRITSGALHLTLSAVPLGDAPHPAGPNSGLVSRDPAPATVSRRGAARSRWSASVSRSSRS